MTDHDILDERRRNDSLVLTLMQEIHTDVRAMNAKMTAHIEEEPKVMADAIQRAMDNAFPDGDALGHRVIHEADIQRVKDRAEFWKKLVFEITKYGLFGVAGWVAYTLWIAFLKGPIK